jgi:predicted chitinase
MAQLLPQRHEVADYLEWELTNLRNRKAALDDELAQLLAEQEQVVAQANAIETTLGLLRQSISRPIQKVQQAIHKGTMTDKRRVAEVLAQLGEANSQAIDKILTPPMKYTSTVLSQLYRSGFVQRFGQKYKYTYKLVRMP